MRGCMQAPLASIRSAAVRSPESGVHGVPHACRFIVRAPATGLSTAAMDELEQSASKVMHQKCGVTCRRILCMPVLCRAAGQSLQLYGSYQVTPPPLPPPAPSQGYRTDISAAL